jgi:hypothetical protein
VRDFFMAAPVLRGFRLGFGHHSCITSSDGAAASIFNSYRDIPIPLIPEPQRGLRFAVGC